MGDFKQMLLNRVSENRGVQPAQEANSVQQSGSFKQMLLSRVKDKAAPSGPFPLKSSSQSLAPMTTEASNVSMNIVSLSSPDYGLKSFEERNKQGDVPVDTETGLGFGTRFALGLRNRDDAKLNYLSQEFGAENVRVADNGEYLVRTLGKDGQVVDVSVNPHGMDVTDAAGILAQAPEIAGSALGAGLIRKIPIKAMGELGKLRGVGGVVRDAVGETAGSFAAGGIKDSVVGAADDNFDAGAILKDRAIQSAFEGSLALISGWGARFFKRTAKYPFPDSREAMQFDAIAAQKYFNKKYGTDVELSLAEATGSPLLMRFENFLGELPGGESIKRFRKKMEGRMLELQSRMVGKTGTDESVGKAVSSRLNAASDAADQAAYDAGKAVRTQALRDLEKSIAGHTSAERTLSHAKIGSEVRSKVTQLRDTEKAKSNYLYEYAKKLDGGTGRVLPTDGLSKRAGEILDNLPKDVRIVDSPTGLYDSLGNPIMAPSKRTEVLAEFVPPNILARLKRLKDLGGQKMSLSELQQMRREVYDDIAKGQAVPGLGTHYLNDIGSSLTKAIEDGIDSLPNAKLKKAWSDANRYYKEKVIPFNKSGISEMFTDPNTPWHIGDAEVASMFLGGSKAADRLANLKSILGPKSAQYGAVKRMIADNVLGYSTTGDNLINAESLSSSLESLMRNSPDVFNEVFGPSAKKATAIITMLSGMKGGVADLPEREVKEILLGAQDVGLFDLQKRFDSLVGAQKKAKELAQNRVINAVRGKDPTKIRPSEFVDYFVDTASKEDVRAVMDLISGDDVLTEKVQRKLVQKIIRKSSRPSTPEDIARMIKGDTTTIAGAKGIAHQLGGDGQIQHYRQILGDEKFDDLIKYLNLTSVRELTKETAGSAGGIAAGMTVSKALAGGLVSVLPKAARTAVESIFITSKPIRKWATMLPADDPGAFALILSSPPFIEAVIDEYGPGTAADEFIDSLKASIQRYVDENNKQTSEEP